MNISKLRILNSKQWRSQWFKFEGRHHQEVENTSSKYLGIILSKQGDSKNYIQDRLNKWRAGTRTLKYLLWNKSITKIQINIYINGGDNSQRYGGRDIEKNGS